MPSCYASGVEQVLVFRLVVEILALLQVIRSGAARLVPLWCCWVVCDLIRFCWLGLVTKPTSRAYGDLWRSSEPVWLLLLLAATIEAYFKPASYYPGSKRLALIGATIVATLAVIITGVVCLPAQAKVVWGLIDLGEMMKLHQVAVGAVGLWMFQTFVLYRILYYPFPRFLYAHTVLLGLYGLLEATAFLLSNTRAVKGLLAAALEDVAMTTCFGLWIYCAKKKWVDFTPATRIATPNEIEQARKDAERTVQSIR